jgi:hypothetical protein
VPQLVPPVPIGVEWDEDVVNQFLELLRRQANTPKFYSQATDPGTSGVPSGTWSIWKNTTSGLVKLWLNDSGTMRSVGIT